MNNHHYTSDAIVNRVIWNYARRSEFGMAKYKMTMSENPGDILYWLTNLQEELMDATLYIERLKEEVRNAKKE